MNKRILIAAVALLLVFIISAAGNNVGGYSYAAESISDGPEPDLIIEDITWSPESLSAGDTVVFTVTIKNQGSSYSGSSRAAYYIDGDYLASDDVVSIDPGDTEKETFTWMANAGSYVVRVVVDANDEVAESNEDNNETEVALSAFLPDLIIEDITWSPEYPSEGDSVTFNIAVKNRGGGNAHSFRVYFYIDGSSRGYQDVVGIEAGGTVIKTFVWTAKADSHILKAVADTSNSVTETNEQNNERSATFLIFPPDLVVDNITWSPESPSESDNVTFTVFIKNQGTTRAGYSQVACYIDDEYLDLSFVEPIDAGATVNATFAWIVKAGDSIFRAVADMGDNIIESDETNNEKTVSMPFFISDLIVQDITLSPESPSAGEPVTLTLTVANQGNARSDPSEVHLYIDGSVIGYRRVDRIDVDATAAVTFLWTPPIGSHTIKAIVDNENQIPESNEDNNETTVTLAEVLTPDLIVQDITWLPESPPIGDTLTFTVTVKNQGNGKADYSYVTYYVDDVSLASVYVNPLDSEATDNKTFTWTVQTGYHTIRAVADVNMRIPESDETNNGTTMIYPAPPDLTIEEITWSPIKPSIGDTLTLDVIVKNQGRRQAGPSDVACYVDGAHLDSAHVDRLLSSAIGKVTFTFTARTESHDIKAVADYKGELLENDETNNEKETTISMLLSDLVIQEMTWTPEVPSESDNVTFNMTVKNRGKGRAVDSEVACYIDDAYLTTIPVDSLDPGATDSVTFVWIAQAGPHSVRAVADGSDSVIERNERNNEKGVTFTVAALPEVPAPETTPSPTTKPPQLPSGETTPFPTLGKGIWLDVLFVLAVLVLAGTFVIVLLRSVRDKR